MKFRAGVFFILSFVVGFLFFSGARSDNNDIVINEIGAYEASGFEWIEIYNRGSAGIDLTGWKFWENNTNHAIALKQGNKVLNPGEFAVITQDDQKFLQKYSGVTSTIWDSSWTTLSEEGEEIGLKFGTGANDFVERFIYIGTDNFSLERVDSNLSDFTENNWIEHVSGNTVGQQNSVFRAPVVEEPVIEVLPTSTPEIPLDVTSSPPQEAPTPVLPEEVPIVASSSSSTLDGGGIVPVVVVDEPAATTTENIPEEAPVLLINEISSVPNDAEKEWIELYNAGSSEALLDGFTLSDGVGVVASPTGTVAANGFFVVDLKSSKLNNDGDAVILKNVSGDVVDAISYGVWDDGNSADNAAVPQKGNTLIRKTAPSTDNNAEDFAETTTVTKGSENILTAPTVEEKNTSSDSSSVQSSNSQSRSETNTAPVAQSFMAGSIVINELLSDPGMENEEFVELFNKTNTQIDLSGAKLKDGGGSVTVLEGVIAAHGFFVVEKPKGNLNNTGDEVFLLDPTGVTLDTVTYGAWNDGTLADNATVANDPMSLSRRIDGVDTNNDAADFVATLRITAGAPNIVDVPAVVDEPTVIASTKLVLNEVFPNPEGEDTNDEFIELFNPTTSTVSLVGWKLSDSSKSYTIHEKVILPGDYAVFLRSVTGISLNNTGGDQVQVFDPSGNIIDALTYSDTAEEGQSYARTESGEFTWTTTLTEGQKNIITTAEMVDDTQTPEVKIPAIKTKVAAVKKKTVKKVLGTKIKSGVHVALSQIREYDKGTFITTTGTVAVVPGILGSQYFYIVDDISGVQIYMSKKDFPDLAVGDQLQVTGQLSESYGETRVNVQTKDQIDILGHGEEPAPQNVELAGINESLEGALVQSTSQVTDVKSGYLYIDDGSGEIKVYFKKGSAVTRDDAALGSTMQVTGIVSQTQGGYQILPRSKNDLVLVASSTTETAPTIKTGSSDLKNFLTAVFGAAVAVILGFLVKIYRTKVSSK